MKLRFLPYIFLFVASISYAQVSIEELNTLKRVADSLYEKEASYTLSLKVYLQLEEALQDDSSSEMAFHTRSRITKNYYMLDDKDTSLAYGQKSLVVAQEEDNFYYQIDALTNIVTGHTLKREFDTAMNYYEQCQTLLKANYSIKLDITSRASLAFLHTVNKDWKAAIKVYQKSLDLATELGDYNLRNDIVSNMSHCHYELLEYDKAIVLCKNALKESKTHDFTPMYNVPSIIGTSYLHLKKNDSAIKYFKLGHKLAKESGVVLHIVTTNNNMGLFYTKNKDYEKGIKYYLQSYHLADSIKNYPTIKDACLALSSAYEQVGDYQNSLHFLQIGEDIKHTLAERSKENKLEEFKTKYESVEKEEQIVLLDRENSLKAAIIGILVLLGLGLLGWQRMNRKKLLAKQENLRYKSIIETELNERKRIAQDLHDSLGQTISAIRMQTAVLPIYQDQKPDHEKLLKQVDHAYDELRNISHNIMPDTLIKLGLVPAIRELISDLNIDNVLSIEVKAEEPITPLTEDQNINLYRIVQEILSNTIKHAQASMIRVILENKNKKIALRIKDNGKGMDPKTIKNSTGMGWKNILSRVTLISAKMDVQSKPNQGTTVSIIF